MAMQESGEMYLETILILSKDHPIVRAIDVAEYMNYSKPSVSRAMGLLKDDGYILINESGHISLTEKGKKRANIIFERHVVLTDVFIKIGVSKETASEDACRIEHYISDETFQAIKNHLKTMC